MLTKKHFVAIARILQESQSKNDIIVKLGAYFAMENERFDWLRWKKACGFGE